MGTTIERLAAHEGERWREIRLRALQEAPDAFGTTFAQASAWPDDRWRKQVAEIATFAAVIDGNDVGVARGAGHPTRPDVRELISMWVAPSARRRGVGSRLVDAIAEWARAEGALTLVLDVREHNASALALYASRGLGPFTGESLGAPAFGETRMALSLASTLHR